MKRLEISKIVNYAKHETPIILDIVALGMFRDDKPLWDWLVHKRL
jgi:hypothetical protein